MNLQVVYRRVFREVAFCAGAFFRQRSFCSTSCASECSTVAQTEIWELSSVAVVRSCLREAGGDGGRDGHDGYRALNAHTTQVLGQVMPPIIHGHNSQRCWGSSPHLYMRTLKPRAVE